MRRRTFEAASPQHPLVRRLVTSARVGPAHEGPCAHWLVHVWLHGQGAGHLICSSEDDALALVRDVFELDEVEGGDSA